jgi:phosphomannomutase
MRHQKRAVIGGEGNGGVIYPSFHAGRDALVGAALVLSCLAEERKSLSELIGTFPRYSIIKSKATLPDDFKQRLERFVQEADGLLGKTEADWRDGVRLDFADGWVQIRSSNTEPIYRLIVETTNRKLTASLHNKITSVFA